MFDEIIQEATVDVECLNCDSDFKTGALKNIGEEVECPHCGHKMIADDDYDEHGNTIWFLNNQKARGEHV